MNREIIVWGNSEKDFKRIGISPKRTWLGYGWAEDDAMFVYEITEDEWNSLLKEEVIANYALDNYIVAEYEKLGKDDKQLVKNYPKDAWSRTGWRWAAGSNCGACGACDWPYKVNGKTLYGFEPNDLEYNPELEYLGEYKHVLEYLCDEVGASTERNVTACCVDLAKGNQMKLSELFKTYQSPRSEQ